MNLLLSQFDSKNIPQSIIERLRSMQYPPDEKQIFEVFETTNENKFNLLYRSSHSMKVITQKNIKVVSYWDEHYPAKLKTLEKPPWNIFYAGNLPNPDTFTLSIVGTRRPNRYGHELIENILVNSPGVEFQTVSGLALGIDALSHRTSIARGIMTFAVLGSSLDEIYPRENAEIAIEIIKNGGGIMSEYPPTTPALKYHFPWRNRIVAALSDSLWVPQASRNSGTRHTIEFANGLGRRICTSPGDVFSELSELPLELMRNGCHPIADGADLLTVVTGRVAI